MKNKILVIFIAISLGVGFNTNAQSGLNKSKDELILFITRPAYSRLYSEVKIDEKSVTTYSKDLSKFNFYSLNSYNRCDREVMSERIQINNYDKVLSFYIGYLETRGFEKSLEVDNKFVNERERIVGYIEKKDEWLNIVFKKY